MVIVFVAFESMSLTEGRYRPVKSLRFGCIVERNLATQSIYSKETTQRQDIISIQHIYVIVLSTVTTEGGTNRISVLTVCNSQRVLGLRSRLQTFNPTFKCCHTSNSCWIHVKWQNVLWINGKPIDSPTPLQSDSPAVL